MTRQRIPLLLNIIMLVAVCVLEGTLLTGLTLLECIGIAVRFAVVWHLLLLWPWITSRTQQFLIVGVLVLVGRKVLCLRL